MFARKAERDPRIIGFATREQIDFATKVGRSSLRFARAGRSWIARKTIHPKRWHSSRNLVNICKGNTAIHFDYKLSQSSFFEAAHTRVFVMVSKFRRTSKGIYSWLTAVDSLCPTRCIIRGYFQFPHHEVVR